MLMNHLHFKIEIISRNEEYFIYEISNNESGKCHLEYNPLKKQIHYPEKCPMGSMLKKNHTQLLKVLSAKNPDKLKIGFSLNFVLDPEKDMKAFRDLSNIIIIDKISSDVNITVKKNGLDNIHEIYADGSYLVKKKKSGFATIIKYPGGDYHLETIPSKLNNSCLVELQAAIRGFEILKAISKIRLITDSQYVRKGLSEWMINWKLNNWYTALGRRAKHIEYWRKLDQLTMNKYIEVAWIKGHSGHFEHTLCDLYAKDAAMESGS